MHLVLACFKFAEIIIDIKKDLSSSYHTLFLGSNEIAGLCYLNLCFSSTPISPGHILILELIHAQEGGNQEASCLGQNMGPITKVFLILHIYSQAFLIVIYSFWPLVASIAFLSLWFLSGFQFSDPSTGFVVRFMLAHLPIHNFPFTLLPCACIYLKTSSVNPVTLDPGSLQPSL